MSKVYSKKIILETVQELKNGSTLLEFDPIGAVKGAWAGAKSAGQNIAGNYHVGAARGAVDDFTKSTEKNWAKTQERITKGAGKLKGSKNPDVQQAGEVIEKITADTDVNVKKALGTLKDKFPASITKMFKPDDAVSGMTDSDLLYDFSTSDFYRSKPEYERVDILRAFKKLSKEEQIRFIKRVKDREGRNSLPAGQPPQQPEPQSEPVAVAQPALPETPPSPEPAVAPAPASASAKAKKKKFKNKNPNAKLKMPPQQAASVQQISAKPVQQMKLPRQGKNKAKIQDAAILPPKGFGSYNIPMPKSHRVPEIQSMADLGMNFGNEVDPHSSRFATADTIPPPGRQRKITPPIPGKAAEPSMKDFVDLLNNDPEQLKMAQQKMRGTEDDGDTNPYLPKSRKNRETMRASKSPTMRPSKFPTARPTMSPSKLPTIKPKV